MKKLNQKSTLELVVNELRAECAAGTWPVKLPGARVLANRLGVSPPTVLKALSVLEGEAVLERPGERKAYRVRKDWVLEHDAKTSKKKKSVLILTHMEIGDLVDTTRSIIEILKSKLIRKGWEVTTQVVDFVHVKAVQKSWDTVIEADPDTPMIVVYGRPVIADWALKQGVKVFFLGGVKDGRKVPSIAVRSSRLAEQAMDILTKLGHSKFVLPLNDRPEAFKVPFREITKNAIESMGATYHASYHNPETPYFMADVIKNMMKGYIQTRLPTAFVFLDWKELVSAHCCLALAGYRVPEDVSLILLNDQAEAEWFEPVLTRFKFPLESMANKICKWLETGQKSVDEMHVDATFVQGHSVAPPRKD